MKTLLLLRHGKAVGTDPAGDRARALAERGRAQSRAVGTLLHRMGLDPDLALVSDARRTRETADLALEAAGSTAVVRLEPGLYHAAPADLLALAQKTDAADKHVLLVGHNPGIGEAARLLVGSGEPQAMIGLRSSFPTGALAVIEFTVPDWTEVAMGAGFLSHFVIPDSDS